MTTKKELLNKGEYELLAAFRYTIRQFLKFSETAAETEGLTPNQHQALLAIKGFPGRDNITNGELAERLGIKHHSAVGLVNRLAERDLVIREQSSIDRREVSICLTETGEKLLEKLTGVHRDELRRLAPKLLEIITDLGRSE